MGRLGNVSATTKVNFYIDDVIQLLNCILKSFKMKNLINTYKFVQKSLFGQMVKIFLLPNRKFGQMKLCKSI